MLLALASLHPALSAQTVPAPAAPPADSEVISLAEFTVTSPNSNDYLASETVTGSRVATSIRDLPYVVNVVTREFIEDFAAFEIGEQLAYTSSFSPRVQEGAYNLRGFFNGSQLRNGFKRAGLVDPSSIDRVEVIKGPAAAIYGQTGPGGTVNIISKRPSRKPTYEFSATAGNLGYVRTDGAASGPLAQTGLGNTYYRVGGAYFEREYEQKFRNSVVRNITTSILHEFNADTNLFLEYDFFDRDTRPGTAAFYEEVPTTVTVINAKTGLPVNKTYNRKVRYVEEMADRSIQGPDEFVDRDMHTFSAHFEHRFNSVLSLRAAGNLYNRHYYRLALNGGSYRPATNSWGTVEPGSDFIYEWGRAAQVDLLARYTTGKDFVMKHTTLLTFDYSFVGDERSFGRRFATADLAALPASQRNISFDDPSYYLPSYTPTLYPRVTGWTNSGTGITGLFLRHNTNLFEDKVKLLAAVRVDHVNAYAKNRLTVVENSVSNDATSPQFGLTYSPIPETSFYVSHAKSFTATTTTNRAGEVLPNETGVSNEVGVKVALFEQKLNFTLSYFDVERENVVVTSVTDNVPILDATGNPVLDSSTGQPLVTNITDSTVEGKDRSRGIDFDFNWAVTPNLLLLGSVTYFDAEVVEAGTDIDRVGRNPREAPDRAWALGGKYSFKEGALDGLNLTGGIRYAGKSYPNNRGGALDLNGDGLSETNEGRRDIYVDGYTLVDVGASYHFRTRDGGPQHYVQVNVKNLFDEEYLDVDAFLADGRVYTFTYGVKF